MTARIGIVGAGSIVRSHHLPVLRNMPGVEVAWVADADPSARRRVSRMHGVSGVEHPRGLARADAILIATPVGAREDAYEHARQGSQTVYLEKPVARTVSELDVVCEHFGGRRVVAGYQRRMYSQFAALGALIRSRELGAVESIVVREGARTTATNVDASFRDDVTVAGGGVLMDLGCHAIDLVQHLIPIEEIRVVQADAVMDELIDREVHIVAELTSGMRPVTIDVALSWLRPIGDRFEVRFEHGSATTSSRPGSPLTLSTGATIDGSGAGSPSAAFAACWRTLLDGHQTKTLDLESCRRGVAIIEAAYEMLRR